MKDHHKWTELNFVKEIKLRRFQIWSWKNEKQIKIHTLLLWKPFTGGICAYIKG